MEQYTSVKYRQTDRETTFIFVIIYLFSRNMRHGQVHKHLPSFVTIISCNLHNEVARLSAVTEKARHASVQSSVMTEVF